MIEAVLLDVGGVLVLPEAALLVEALDRAGIPGVTPADLARGHYAGVAAMDRSALSKGLTADWPGYRRALVASLGVADREMAMQVLATAYATVPWTTIIRGAIDGLRGLAGTGVALGIVSNSNGTIEEQLLTQGIAQVGAGEGVPVVVVVDSGSVGIEKPHPAIFEHALAVLGVAPGDAVHVGDTGWADVAGAQAAGIRPLHLDPHGDCPSPEGHEHVRDLAEVVALVADDPG
jgi:putative hydrolase of the HAD superfamily